MDMTCPPKTDPHVMLVCGRILERKGVCHEKEKIHTGTDYPVVKLRYG
jgi:hypothetical protein